ncbi:hypothetical protein GCM10027423_47960 [Spirosoma arcticum]
MWRAVSARLLLSLLLVQVLTTTYSQNPLLAVFLPDIPADGLLLNEGWRFRSGDNPIGASPQLDDRQWSNLDPTKDIRDLPQLQRSGVGWLRLHMTTGPGLPSTMVHVFQSVASEIYLDGRLLYRFGTVSTIPERVQAYNPNAAFYLPLQSSSEHLLAVRFACQPGLDYNTKHLRWDAATVQFWLSPATVLPAVRPLSIQAVYLDTFRIGIAFILFILHLSLFFAYRVQQANLYAAGMYLLLSVTFWARAANNFAHSMNLRMLLHYGSLLDTWVPGMAILIFYSLFKFRIGWLFWLAIGSIGLRFVPLPTDYQWLNTFFSYYLQFEIIRLSVVATRRGLLGARIVRFGAFCNLGLWITFSVLSVLRVPVGGNEWLYHTLFVVSFLCFPLTLSLRLALEHGWVNRQLMDRLQDVEHLSARNLAQQREREQLLARQNEQLEQQVVERTQKLNQQADQLRELDQIKSRFVTNLTHEFRTPLSLIVSPVEKLLQESRFDRPMLTMVHRNANQLLRLINQLLDLSKLEGDYMTLSSMQGNVTDFICHVVELFQRSAEQKGVILTCALENLPPQEFVFDPDKWEKILTNLLSNSLKFTPTGGHVTITGTPIWASGAITGVQIQLVDSGIGITPEALPHIFDRFYQADTSSRRAYEGTGIGLALSNELIGLLGGTITVESQLNVGTTFRLTLPVQPVSAAIDAPTISWSAMAQPALAPLAALAPGRVINRAADDQAAPRILVVEDNDELRNFLVDELTPSYHVLQATDGVAGWELTQAKLPDMVLTDVMMPRMDGYELTRLIKGHVDTDHIAVVMLTAKSAQPSRIEGLQQGADDYLSKPFSVEELQLRLHNLMSRQAKLGEHYRQQFVLPGVDSPASDPSSSVDVSTVLPDPFLLRIYALLEQHLDDPTISVDWLADQLAMNRKTLYRKVQHLIQLSPADLIRQYRLRKAAELLKAGYNVAETADRVGFNTPSHFTLVFKETYQQTPTEFMASRVKNA